MADAVNVKVRGTCSLPTCDRPHYARGWCNMHYLRWYKRGTAEQIEQERRTVPAIERFWPKVDRTSDPNGCWLWLGFRDRLGYGSFAMASIPKRPTPAHRAAYMLLVGPIPEGLVLDHLCRNPPCVNPAHLEPVTQQENLRRGIHPNTAKTHCKHGHPFDDANTYLSPRGTRTCRACTNASRARYLAKQAA